MRLRVPLLAVVTISWCAMAHSGPLTGIPNVGPIHTDGAAETVRSANTVAIGLPGASANPVTPTNSPPSGESGPTLAAPPASNSMTRFDLTLLVRIGIAAALAFIVGWEREFRGSEAGDRTFTLVSIGAAAFTAVGVENFPVTAEKVMAGVVTGVGFLGGGMILRDGGNIRGLTTAAALWATAAIGMLAGVGEMVVSVWRSHL